MTSIVRATVADCSLIVALGRKTFIESHGHSAQQSDINEYIGNTYSTDFLTKDLSDPKNIYLIIYHENRPAGYSKIILNYPSAQIELKNITKLEKIFLLKDFYDLQLGSALFSHNLAISKKHNQSGIWLFVWTENRRAISFYTKKGFKVVGHHDFRISENHSNPNYQMFLEY